MGASGVRDNRSTQGAKGLHPALLVAAYLAIAVAPLAISYAEDLPPRGFRDELSSGLAMVAFAMMLAEFVLSGRFKTVSDRIGIDLTMRFHQLIARSLTAFILIHPFLYATPLDRSRPWDTSGQLTLGLDAASLITGVFAWVLLGVLFLMAIGRDKMPFRYEVWRVLHGLGAAAIAVAGAHHAIEAGRYSGRPILEAFWLLLVGIALLTILYVYVITPLLQVRHPYRVVSVEKKARKTWELVIEPVKGEALGFLAGQFVWLTLGRSPFAVTEHPFSISSSPAQRPQIAFTIKEAGDFTNAIGNLPVGSEAYLDGPHGNLTLAGRGGTGVVFLAGGVGLAPIMSLLRQAKAERDPRPMILIYGNRLADQILYRQELEDLTADLDLKLEFLLSEPPGDWAGPVGTFDRTTLDKLLGVTGREDRLYIVCGPAPMIDSVEDTLEGLGIPMGQILSEKLSYH
jgi:predicted ferric reductase